MGICQKSDLSCSGNSHHMTESIDLKRKRQSKEFDKEENLSLQLFFYLPFIACNQPTYHPSITQCETRIVERALQLFTTSKGKSSNKRTYIRHCHFTPFHTHHIFSKQYLLFLLIKAIKKLDEKHKCTRKWQKEGKIVIIFTLFT